MPNGQKRPVLYSKAVATEKCYLPGAMFKVVLAKVFAVLSVSSRYGGCGLRIQTRIVARTRQVEGTQWEERVGPRSHDQPYFSNWCGYLELNRSGMQSFRLAQVDQEVCR